MSDDHLVYTHPQPNQQHSTPEEVMKMQMLLDNGNSVLYSISSVFPFDIFSTTISVEKTKLNVVRNLFFGSQRVESILITELAQVEVDTTLFFASLYMHSRLVNADPIIVYHLRKAEALKMRRIVTGLMVGVSAKVDWSKVATDELLTRIEEIGSTKVAI